MAVSVEELDAEDFETLVKYSIGGDYQLVS